MFLSHNGHGLWQMEDIIKIFKRDFLVISSKIQNANNTNKNFLKAIQLLKEKIEAYKSIQLKYIDDGFTQIFRKLENKKMDMTNQFTNKYNLELKLISQLEDPFKKAQDDILILNKTFINYKKMFENYWQQAVLRKFTDIIILSVFSIP